MEGVLDKDQKLDEGRVESEDGKLNLEMMRKLSCFQTGRVPMSGYSRCAGGVGHSAGRMVAYDGASSWGSAEVE